MEVVHLEQDADLAVLSDLFVDNRCEGFISLLPRKGCFLPGRTLVVRNVDIPGTGPSPLAR